LLNRKSIMDEIHKAWRRFSNTQQPFAVIALDIDNLQSVNVAYGYPMGDALLTEISKSMNGVLRPDDVLGRAGGGKMIAILPAASLILARVTAERMRGQVADMQHLFADQRVKVSASLGVVLSELSDLSEEGVLARANAQLERAKAGGRNRVEIDNRGSAVQTGPVVKAI
jgi:diguanylate cyclase